MMWFSLQSLCQDHPQAIQCPLQCLHPERGDPEFKAPAPESAEEHQL